MHFSAYKADVVICSIPQTLKAIHLLRLNTCCRIRRVVLAQSPIEDVPLPCNMDIQVTLLPYKPLFKSHSSVEVFHIPMSLNDFIWIMVVLIYAGHMVGYKALLFWAKAI